jgi:RimJ/RimL family protein N-acetyltransferase
LTVLLQEYHKTHVNTHAMALSLRFLFDDLHLVRVQWDAVPWHEASQRSAFRYGFTAEGILRNLHGQVPDGKRREGEGHRKSQDLWVASMTDYDWENDGRERMRLLVEKPVVDTSR